RVPISVQSFGSFRATRAGGAIVAASAATAPNVTLRPLGRCVIVLLGAAHSLPATFQRAAAAAMSISRAVAPARRRSFCDALMERLAPGARVAHTPRR